MKTVKIYNSELYPVYRESAIGYSTKTIQVSETLWTAYNEAYERFMELLEDMDEIVDGQ